MSTPSKQKIQAIRTYLINKVHDALEAENTTIIAKATTKHKANIQNIQRIHKKLLDQLEAYSSLQSFVSKQLTEDNIRFEGVPCVSVHKLSPKSFNLIPQKHSTAYVYLRDNHYNSGLYCTEAQFEKAKEAIKQIDNYCLELQISPDMADIESFAKALIKTLK